MARVSLTEEKENAPRRAIDLLYSNHLGTNASASVGKTSDMQAQNTQILLMLA